MVLETGAVFEEGKSNNRLDIRFSSTMTLIDDVCTSVTRFMASRKMNPAPDFFAVNLVIREGLTNAIRHGNKKDPSKMVWFRMKIDKDNTIRVSIADQGKGFDWSGAQSAPLPEKADHGRGMFIMKTYFDRCGYNNAGNVLYLEKKSLPGPGQKI